MSLRVIKHTRDPLETIERMLNKTALVTQRIGHNHIMGEFILVKCYLDCFILFKKRKKEKKKRKKKKEIRKDYSNKIYGEPDPRVRCMTN